VDVRTVVELVIYQQSHNLDIGLARDVHDLTDKASLQNQRLVLENP